jgi:hypothetical protein
MVSLLVLFVLVAVSEAVTENFHAANNIASTLNFTDNILTTQASSPNAYEPFYMYNAYDTSQYSLSVSFGIDWNNAATKVCVHSSTSTVIDNTFVYNINPSLDSSNLCWEQDPLTNNIAISWKGNVLYDHQALNHDGLSSVYKIVTTTSQKVLFYRNGAQIASYDFRFPFVYFYGVIPKEPGGVVHINFYSFSAVLAFNPKASIPLPIVDYKGGLCQHCFDFGVHLPVDARLGGAGYQIATGTSDFIQLQFDNVYDIDSLTFQNNYIIDGTGYSLHGAVGSFSLAYTNNISSTISTSSLTADENPYTFSTYVDATTRQRQIYTAFTLLNGGSEALNTPARVTVPLNSILTANALRVSAESFSTVIPQSIYSPGIIKVGVNGKQSYYNKPSIPFISLIPNTNIQANNGLFYHYSVYSPKYASNSSPLRTSLLSTQAFIGLTGSYLQILFNGIYLVDDIVFTALFDGRAILNYGVVRYMISYATSAVLLNATSEWTSGQDDKFTFITNDDFAPTIFSNPLANYNSFDASPTYTGCYSHTTNARIFSNFLLIDFGVMIIQECNTAAYAAGYNYFSLENGIECWAGTTSSTTTFTDTTCTAQCNSIPGVMCGGATSGSIYKTVATSSSSQWNIQQTQSVGAPIKANAIRIHAVSCLVNCAFKVDVSGTYIQSSAAPVYQPQIDPVILSADSVSTIFRVTSHQPIYTTQTQINAITSLLTESLNVVSNVRASFNVNAFTGSISTTCNSMTPATMTQSCLDTLWASVGCITPSTTLSSTFWRTLSSFQSVLADMYSWSTYIGPTYANVCYGSSTFPTSFYISFTSTGSKAVAFYNKDPIFVSKLSLVGFDYDVSYTPLLTLIAQHVILDPTILTSSVVNTVFRLTSYSASLITSSQIKLITQALQTSVGVANNVRLSFNPSSFNLSPSDACKGLTPATLNQTCVSAMWAYAGCTAPIAIQNAWFTAQTLQNIYSDMVYAATSTGNILYCYGSAGIPTSVYVSFNSVGTKAIQFYNTDPVFKSTISLFGFDYDTTFTPILTIVSAATTQDPNILTNPVVTTQFRVTTSTPNVITSIQTNAVSNILSLSLNVPSSSITNVRLSFIPIINLNSVQPINCPPSTGSGVTNDCANYLFLIAGCTIQPDGATLSFYKALTNSLDIQNLAFSYTSTGSSYTNSICYGSTTPPSSIYVAFDTTKATAITFFQTSSKPLFQAFGYPVDSTYNTIIMSSGVVVTPTINPGIITASSVTTQFRVIVDSPSTFAANTGNINILTYAIAQSLSAPASSITNVRMSQNSLNSNAIHLQSTGQLYVKFDSSNNLAIAFFQTSSTTITSSLSAYGLLLDTTYVINQVAGVTPTTQTPTTAIPTSQIPLGIALVAAVDVVFQISVDSPLVFNATDGIQASIINRIASSLGVLDERIINFNMIQTFHALSHKLRLQSVGTLFVYFTIVDWTLTGRKSGDLALEFIQLSFSSTSSLAVNMLQLGATVNTAFQPQIKEALAVTPRSTSSSSNNIFDNNHYYYVGAAAILILIVTFLGFFFNYFLNKRGTSLKEVAQNVVENVTTSLVDTTQAVSDAVSS